MKRIKYLVLCSIFITNIAFSDEIIIPFTNCYPKEIQKDFKKYGRKLDLNAEDRTRESWAFIKSEGSRYTIYTYEDATQEDFDIIKKVVFR